ncbi:MAG: SDR family NAD(P)-dependent oxidoreductase [Clostridia bacterium]|jgi:short-subunit dehydrogenase|nr:SDR family NAD(P)-dependent oxidoreductase [Clostridia bacterium]
MSVAIITGASSGLGREFALQLYRANEVDEFYLIARREDRLKELKNELDGKAKVISADLTTSEGINKIREALISDKPDVKYLINASGFGKFGDYSEISEKETERMIDLNVKASVLITHMTIPYMKKGSHIIELGSGSCFTPLPNFNVYAAGKSFILHYTKALKYEIKPLGITATAFCPGWVDTEFLGKATEIDGAKGPKAKAIKPLLRADKVVAKAIRDAKRGRVMSVTNWYTKLQHLLFKILPDCLLTKAWLGMQK